MKKTLHKAWVYLFISGICSLIFGITVLAFPAIPLLTLVWSFAAYMVIKGLALSLGAFQNRHEETHWLFLLSYGLLNVITGIIAYVYPGPTLIILGFIVSLNLLAGGILQVIMAFHLHKEIRQTGWLICSGVITIIAAIYIYLIPRIAVLSILYLIAVAALIVSIFLIFLSLKAIHWHSHINKEVLQIP